MTPIVNPVTSLGALLIAVFLSTGGAFAIIHNLPYFLESRTWLIDLIIATSFGTAITAAFYTGFHRGLFLKQLNPFKDPRSMISVIPLIQSISILMYVNRAIPDPAFYISTVTLQTWNTYLCFVLSQGGININHSIMDRLSWLACGVVAFFGIIAWPFRNFWPLPILILSFMVFQAVVHVTLHVGIIVWFSLHPSHAIKGQGLLANARSRLKMREETTHHSVWLSSTIAGVVQLSMLLLVASFIPRGPDTTDLLLAVVAQFLFFPSMLDSWARLEHVSSKQENLAALSRLTASSARRLILRHRQQKDSWAATVGLRTVTLTIDHDPDAVIGNRVPANLMRIRDEEILGLINQLTKHQSLSLSSISQKVIGTLDPESSARPCVDALNLCATMYLDAGPLVERRISGLVSLLPIVNPGLAQAINLNHLTPMLKRNQWFFHFDYSWVDQSIINTPTAARYGIQLDPVTPEARIAMLEHMRKTHSVGNFVWIGKDAYDRILQEAPYISPVFEPQVVVAGTSREILAFAAKFEQLIPRLQRYYALDAVRAKVIDYEPSAEAQRLLKLLSFQARNAKALTEKRRIIDSVASYKWHGFKEKDQALKLLLQIYETEKEASSQNAGPQKYALHEALADTLREAVSKVGYPSQIMNQAHMYKIQLRDLTKLRSHAMDPASSRFEESWVLLGNMDYVRYGEPEIAAIREIVGDALRDPGIMKNPVAQSKVIDCTVSLIRRAPANTRPGEIRLLVSVMDGIIKYGAREECLAMALDAAIFLSELENCNIPFSPAAVAFFETTLSEQKQAGQMASQALYTRWQEHRGRFTTATNSLPRAG